MSKTFKLIVLCLAITSCSIEDIKYTKDYRTGLCFATLNLGSNNGTMTNVPCSPEVEKQIQSVK